MTRLLLVEQAVAVANESTSLRAGWVALRELLGLEALADADLAADVQGLHAHFVELFAAEPPDDAVDTIYVGLTLRRDGFGTVHVGYYACGVVGFDPEDLDTLCDPQWFPDGRYLRSTTLDALYAEEAAASERGERDLANRLDEPGRLGTAALLTRFALPSVAWRRRVVVGFDASDEAFTLAAPSTE